MNEFGVSGNVPFDSVLSGCRGIFANGKREHIQPALERGKVLPLWKHQHLFPHFQTVLGCTFSYKRSVLEIEH